MLIFKNLTGRLLKSKLEEYGLDSYSDKECFVNGVELLCNVVDIYGDTISFENHELKYYDIDMEDEEDCFDCVMDKTQVGYIFFSEEDRFDLIVEIDCFEIIFKRHE